MNFIVAKGWGGNLVVTGGWGADPGIASSILRFSTGNLRIDIRRISGVAYLYFNDGDNMILEALPASVAQLSAEEWMLVTLVRVGSNLHIILDNQTPIIVPLVQVKSYGGSCYIMENNSGGVFDVRALPRVIIPSQKQYYMTDLAENEGKALLP